MGATPNAEPDTDAETDATETAARVITTIDSLAAYYDGRVTYGVEPGRVVVQSTTPDHEHAAKVLAAAFKQAGLAEAARTERDGAAIAVKAEAIDRAVAVKANAAAFENTDAAMAALSGSESRSSSGEEGRA